MNYPVRLRVFSFLIPDSFWRRSELSGALPNQAHGYSFILGILTKEPPEQALGAYRVIVGFVGRYVLILLVYT